MEKLRLSYQSMVTPGTVYDYDVKTGALETLKTQEIFPAGYDATQYVTERVSIAARDGTMVPVSIVMRKDRAGNPENRPGSKGRGRCTFILRRLWLRHPAGLFDHAAQPRGSRGSPIATGAYPRRRMIWGGRWYLQGKLFERTNTFNDLICRCRARSDRQGLYREGMVSPRGGLCWCGDLMGRHQSGSRPYTARLSPTCRSSMC